MDIPEDIDGYQPVVLGKREPRHFSALATDETKLSSKNSRARISLSPDARFKDEYTDFPKLRLGFGK